MARDSVQQPGTCYNRIRFAMDDEDGWLRFRRISVEGEGVCGVNLQALEAYLAQRPLREIDLDEVRRITAGCHPQCGAEIIRVIAEQQAFFCRHLQAEGSTG